MAAWRQRKTKLVAHQIIIILPLLLPVEMVPVYQRYPPEVFNSIADLMIQMQFKHQKPAEIVFI